MRIAAITFVYNESFNLPNWVKYYGGNLGMENLFVVDRGSDDGSTSNLGDVNVIRIPRKDYDENEKTNFMGLFHKSLLSFYDYVILSDCDEIVVADPEKYKDLRSYIETCGHSHVTCVGLDVVHIIDREPRLHPERSLLSQRRFAQFHRASCKTAISGIPTDWLPGFHHCNHAPNFDPDLYLMHLKYSDLYTSVDRQFINIDTVWSQNLLESNLAKHHRFDLPTFVHAGFLVPSHDIRINGAREFKFDAEINEMLTGTQIDHEGFHRFSLVGNRKVVMIPERFGSAL